jgi:hypothetical protein
VHGSALWYEPGDWYTLSLGGAGTNEYIDATVEIVSVSVQRTAGGIGSTSLLVRECMESWSKTTLYTARLVTGASPKRRTNQSNTLIVASSSFDGTYDYRCDGTADDVQIQAAINYLSTTVGGGTVQLTGGSYHCSQLINAKSNVIICGTGMGTIIFGRGVSFQFTNVDNAEIKDFLIDGSEAAAAYTIIYATDDTVGTVNKITGIRIRNFIPDVNGNSYMIYSTGAYRNLAVSNSIFDDMTATSGNTSVHGLSGVQGAYNNIIGTMTKYGSGVAYGMISCNKCQQNKVAGASTAKYFQSYADSGTSNACADNYQGGFNS